MSGWLLPSERKNTGPGGGGKDEGQTQGRTRRDSGVSIANSSSVMKPRQCEGGDGGPRLGAPLQRPGSWRAQGASAWWAPPASTPTGASQGHSKAQPAVTDGFHHGRQGRCPRQLGDSFSSASPTPFGSSKSLCSLTPATPMSPVSLCVGRPSCILLCIYLKPY